ncbi:hypothetical protein AGDE_15949 [Angomonas deanei]|uniref:Uncharacterized protein n=1 Tax=Angomonas deanei TaxID=59799 RepID=A0A7G2CT97_9TRYP|nr:hypothetical protein AGDE_15949 [Angomonas deanei]CAD2221663.1 hypothetical protein, conserved [Angomonas deanei]|eukprot:EPY18073.1 hypothetical protein AGDE_15949 [Angomonas deanei]
MHHHHNNNNNNDGASKNSLDLLAIVAKELEFSRTVGHNSNSTNPNAVSKDSIREEEEREGLFRWERNSRTNIDKNDNEEEEEVSTTSSNSDSCEEETKRSSHHHRHHSHSEQENGLSEETSPLRWLFLQHRFIGSTNPSSNSAISEEWLYWYENFCFALLDHQSSLPVCVNLVTNFLFLKKKPTTSAAHFTFEMFMKGNETKEDQREARYSPLQSFYPADGSTSPPSGPFQEENHNNNNHHQPTITAEMMAHYVPYLREKYSNYNVEVLFSNILPIAFLSYLMYSTHEELRRWLTALHFFYHYHPRPNHHDHRFAEKANGNKNNNQHYGFASVPHRIAVEILRLTHYILIFSPSLFSSSVLHLIIFSLLSNETMAIIAGRASDPPGSIFYLEKNLRKFVKAHSNSSHHEEQRKREGLLQREPSFKQDNTPDNVGAATHPQTVHGQVQRYHRMLFKPYTITAVDCIEDSLLDIESTVRYVKAWCDVQDPTSSTMMYYYHPLRSLLTNLYFSDPANHKNKSNIKKRRRRISTT